MKCTWCKGTGYIWINKMKIICFNCKGTKYGPDGGSYKNSQRRHELLLGNTQKFQQLKGGDENG